MVRVLVRYDRGPKFEFSTRHKILISREVIEGDNSESEKIIIRLVPPDTYDRMYSNRVEQVKRKISQMVENNDRSKRFKPINESLEYFERFHDNFLSNSFDNMTIEDMEVD